MDIELQTVEVPSGASLFSAPDRCTLQEDNIPQEHQTSAISQAPTETSLREAKEIARAEMARRRRHLGKLTREQEIGLENLVMSTVTRISELVERVLESRPVVP